MGFLVSGKPLVMLWYLELPESWGVSFSSLIEFEMLMKDWKLLPEYHRYSTKVNRALNLYS